MDYKICRLVSEHIPGAVEVLRQSFMTDEKVCSCLRVLQDSEEVSTNSKYKVTKVSREIENMAVDIIKDGVSLCAVDVKTHEVVGVAINKIQVKPKPGELAYFDQFTRDHIKEKCTQAFMDFMGNVDARYDLFGKSGGCFFEIVCLSVKSTSNGKGIGTALVTESVRFAQRMKDFNEKKDASIDLFAGAEEYKSSGALLETPKLVSAIFTSRFSQKCGNRSGFDEVLKIPYTEFEYQGKKFSETTGPDHPYTVLAVKMLD